MTSEDRKILQSLTDSVTRFHDTSAQISTRAVEASDRVQQSVDALRIDVRSLSERLHNVVLEAEKTRASDRLAVSATCAAFDERLSVVEHECTRRGKLGETNQIGRWTGRAAWIGFFASLIVGIMGLIGLMYTSCEYRSVQAATTTQAPQLTTGDLP